MACVEEAACLGPSAKGALGRTLLSVSSCGKGRATSLQWLEFQWLGPQPVRHVGG